MSSVFGGGQTQAPTQTVYVPYTPPQAAQPTPAPAPPAPPNPPMFGSQQTPVKGSASQTAFNSSVIGTLPAEQPQRTLLGTA